MANEKHAQQGEVKVRVLRDCQYGKCDAVVLMDAALVESLEGVVDAHPSAVAYAESLLPGGADAGPSLAELLAARDALMRREGELNEQAEQLRQQAIDNDAEAGRLADLRAKLDGEAKRLADDVAQLASDKSAFEAAKATAPVPATGKNKAPAA